MKKNVLCLFIAIVVEPSPHAFAPVVDDDDEVLGEVEKAARYRSNSATTPHTLACLQRKRETKKEKEAEVGLKSPTKGLSISSSTNSSNNDDAPSERLRLLERKLARKAVCSRGGGTIGASTTDAWMCI